MDGEAHLDCDQFDLLQTFYDEESCLEELIDNNPFVIQRLNTTGSSAVTEVRQKEQVSPRFQVPPETVCGSAMFVQVQNCLNSVTI